jgi:nicotinate-nucleotide adenylyltransferase
MRLGILGGSFNPIHHGHLFTAEAAAAAFDLEQVLLVPAHQSPFKPVAEAAAADRLQMVRLAAAENPRLRVSTVDLDRPPPSYSADTVALLGARYTSADLFLILGADALQDFLEWREPQRLLDLCRLIVVSRPGYPLEIPPDVARGLGGRSARIMLLTIPQLEISSTDLRGRFRRGEPVRYLLPDAVERYVREQRLYGTR